MYVSTYDGVPSRNLLATILLMIGVWGVPGNVRRAVALYSIPLTRFALRYQSTYFAIISAYTQNEASVVIPRLVISFRENYDGEGQPSQHSGNAAQQTVRSEKMVFEKRAMTDDFELQTVDQAQPPLEEEVA